MQYWDVVSWENNQPKAGDVVTFLHGHHRIYAQLIRFMRKNWEAVALIYPRPEWGGLWNCHPEAFTIVPEDEWPDEVYVAIAKRALIDGE